MVGISDSDTIRVLHDEREVRVRLWGIDAPESKQPLGEAGEGVYRRSGVRQDGDRAGPRLWIGTAARSRRSFCRTAGT
jgi:endonuclease YncB( thermonuclease family)